MAGGTAPTVFIAELTYAGVFTLTGLPENAIEPVLLVECPRILFPFARNILADVTRDGGFPPVLLQPIDFVALWQAAGRRRRRARPPRRDPRPRAYQATHQGAHQGARHWGHATSAHRRVSCGPA